MVIMSDYFNIVFSDVSVSPKFKIFYSMLSFLIASFFILCLSLRDWTQAGGHL